MCVCVQRRTIVRCEQQLIPKALRAHTELQHYGLMPSMLGTPQHSLRQECMPAISIASHHDWSAYGMYPQHQGFGVVRPANISPSTAPAAQAALYERHDVQGVGKIEPPSTTVPPPPQPATATADVCVQMGMLPSTVSTHNTATCSHQSSTSSSASERGWYAHPSELAQDQVQAAWHQWATHQHQHHMWYMQNMLAWQVQVRHCNSEP